MKIMFDIGGSKTRIAKSFNNKTIEKVVSFPTAKNFDEGFNNVVKHIEVFAQGENLTHIGGGIAGVLNEEKTDIASSSNLSSWAGHKIGKHLKDIFRIPVALENDAALAALGEAVHGSGVDFDSFIYLTIGTGIGGAWIVNGELVKGNEGFEPGHQTIELNGPPCPSCRQLGHWEAFLSGTAINNRYGKIASDITDENIIDEMENYLAVGLANTFMHWPSEGVIIGGGAALHTSWSMKRVQEKLAKRLSMYANTPSIQLAQLGDEAALYGALLLQK